MIIKLIQLSILLTIVSAKMDPICKMDAPLGVDPETCCKVPDMLDHATLEKCAILAFDSNSTDISSEVITKGSGQCLFECIFKEHGIFKNNTVLTDRALKLLKEVIQSDAEWMPIVTNAISTCKAMAASITKTEGSTCSPLPAFHFGCFHTQLFKVSALLIDLRKSIKIFRDKYLELMYSRSTIIVKTTVPLQYPCKISSYTFVLFKTVPIRNGLATKVAIR